MWRTTIKGVLARKVRLGLTALAVVLGVTFVSGTYVLTDTLKHSFDTIFAQTAVGIDVVVRSRPPLGDRAASRERVPERLLDVVRAMPGVAKADGVVNGYAQFVGKSGSAIQNGGAPTFGFSWPADGVGPLRIVPGPGGGRPPVRDGEVAMDAGTARREGFKVGDTVKVLLTGPVQRFELVGIFGIGSRVDLGAVSVAAFDTATAQRVFDAPGLFDAIDVVAAPGTTPAQLRRALVRAAPAGFEVTSSEQLAADTGQPVRQGLGFLNDALLGFAALGLFVGAFIIFNTFTILVSQRTRELGLLRALGASTGQIVRSVIGEAVVVGAVASAIGLGLGVALGNWLPSRVRSAGFPLPSGSTVLLPRTVVAAVAVGLGVTVASAIYPAVRASRISPVAAIEDLRPTSVAPLRRRGLAGTTVLVVSLVVVGYGLAGSFDEFTSRIEVVGLGALGSFVGVALLGPLFARPLSRWIGAGIAPALGVSGTLARGNAMRNPRRTSATASALMIGLSLVCLVAIFAASAKASVQDALASGVRADLVLDARQFAGFSPDVARRVRAQPDVAAATGLRFDEARVGNNTETITSAAAAGLDQTVNLDYVHGGSRGLDEGGILLHADEARGYHVGVGDTLAIEFPRSGIAGLRVIGVYRNKQFTGGIPVSFIVGERTFASGFTTTSQDSIIFVKAEPGRLRAARREIAVVLRDFPNVRAQTLAGFQRQQEQSIDQFLTVLVALLLLSEVIAILGIVNTLALSVFERTRELGLLRAVGMSRRQVRRMVRGESVIIAVIGGIIGVAVGLFWGFAFTQALRKQGITHFAVPPVQLLGFVAASAVAGVIAAVLPAWRASRLDVLEAIATE